MFPHERSLVTRLQGKPFVLLGVNTDETREELQQTLKENDLGWRNWWDGEGKIAERWGVEGFPTLFLIDHKGVVRQMFEGAPPAAKLDRAIDGLVQEAEEDAAKAPPAAGRAETNP